MLAKPKETFAPIADKEETTMSVKPAVLFVCLGNICRSPLAEAAFRREAEMVGLDVDVGSAGTGDWHAEQPPDGRAQAVARRNGIDIASYRARQITRGDFHRFTHIVALDTQNLNLLKAMKPKSSRAEISLLLDHVDGRLGQAVLDPYFGDAEGFDTAWSDITAGVKALALKLAQTGSAARPG